MDSCRTSIIGFIGAAGKEGADSGYVPLSVGFADSGRYPVQTNTGRRGYLTNLESSNESSHLRKIEPRSDSIRRAWCQLWQRSGPRVIRVSSLPGDMLSPLQTEALLIFSDLPVYEERSLRNNYCRSLSSFFFDRQQSLVCIFE